MKITDVTINTELRNLLPPLSPDERSLLVESIQREGFRDAVIVWLGHGTLLDGHNRMTIWKQELGADEDKAPEIVERPFASIEAAKEWMLRNQLARRNLTDAQRIQVTLRLKPFIEQKAAANLTKGGRPKDTDKGLVNLPKVSELVNTRKELAETAGVSEKTFAKAEAVLEKGTQETKAAMLAPKSDESHISISKAYETVRPSKHVAIDEAKKDRAAMAAVTDRLLSKSVGDRMRFYKQIVDHIASSGPTLNLTYQDDAEFWCRESQSALERIKDSNPFKKRAWESMGLAVQVLSGQLPDIAIEVEEYDDDEVESAVEASALA
jgi:hypothetical protein